MTVNSNAGSPPSIETFAAGLLAIAAGPVDFDRGLFDQEHLDSVDVVEWLYSLEDHYNFVIDEETIDDLETASIRRLYERYGNGADQ